MRTAALTRLLAAAATVAALAPLALADPVPAPTEAARTKARPILHLRLHGDLDSAKLADDFARAVEEAPAQGAQTPLLLLEVTGRRWRTDVVLSIARIIRNEHQPLATIVYLNSPSTGIGTGQAALGLVADACYLSPRTRIAWDPADDLRALALDGFDHGAAEQELRGLAWTALQERQGDALLMTLVPRPTSALYAIALPGEGNGNGNGAASRVAALKLAALPPDSGEYTTLIPPIGDKGPARVAIDCDTACRIGFSAGIAGSVSEVLTRQSIRPGKRTETTLESGLRAARVSLDRAIRGIDETRRQAAAAIDQVWRYRTPEMVARQRRVGDDQGPILDAAKHHLEQAEQLTVEYPELLRAAPPGTTSVGQTSYTLQRAWRDLFQDRREDLDKLADRAKTLAEKQLTPP